MANAVWPPSLPDYVELSGFGEEPPWDIENHQMDRGPGKERGIWRGRVFAGTVTMDPTQRATFDDFYVNTVRGPGPFDWVHPITRDPATLSIIARPKYTARSSILIDIGLKLRVLA